MKNKRQKQKQHKDKILNSIPIFLAKTYRIVDNPQNVDTIDWTPQQNGFIVKNISQLTQKIFPNHFKHTNYASFVRQLNLYGFHKVRSNGQGHIFTHNSFQKNNPDLLPLIKRKNTLGLEIQKLQKNQQIVLRNSSASLLPIQNIQVNNKQPYYQKQLKTLTQKHQMLQNLVSMLVEQNKQIIMQNKNFINKINTVDDNYRKKLQTLIFLMVFGLKNGQNNIIMPQQLNNMIKAFTTNKFEKKSKSQKLNINQNQTSTQAIQLFKKTTQDQSRFNNKNIQQILQMLKMQSQGGDNSDNQQPQQQNIIQNSVINSVNNGHDSVKGNRYQDSQVSYQDGLQFSPILSLRSIPSRFHGDKFHDDWNDILYKLQNQGFDVENSKQ